MLRNLVVLVLACALGRVSSAQTNDPLLSRVQQLVNAGNRDGARALADSALLVRTVGTHGYAEALYARGVATADATSAERDYLRITIEYPFSPRVEDALLMVAQLRQARGDRAGARAQYERLSREFPRGTHAARSAYWAGRLALDDGDLSRGCTSLFEASERVSREDVELRNQIEYLRRRCMMPAGGSTVTAPPRDTTPARDTTTTPVAGAQEYSVQVAAFQRKRDADALASRLRARSFQVRVAGTRAPYRVRVGRYATRDAAVAAQDRMQRAGVRGIVVEAEPR